MAPSKGEPPPAQDYYNLKHWHAVRSIMDQVCWFVNVQMDGLPSQAVCASADTRKW